MASRSQKQAPPDALSPQDLCAMLLADRDVQVAQRDLLRARDAQELARLRAELAAMNAAAALREVAVRAAQADAAHERVVADIGRRYAVDWQATSFVPETGELVAITPGSR